MENGGRCRFCHDTNMEKDPKKYRTFILVLNKSKYIHQKIQNKFKRVFFKENYNSVYLSSNKFLISQK